MSFYTDLVNNTVIPMMKEFGVTVTLLRSGSTETWVKTFDAVNSRDYWKNTSTGEEVYEEPIDIPSEYFPVVLESSFTKSEMSKDMILRGDKKYYISPEIVRPQNGDVLEIDDVKYRIYYVNIIKPASVTMLYEVYAKV